jgi:hypothetical protein
VAAKHAPPRYRSWRASAKKKALWSATFPIDLGVADHPPRIVGCPEQRAGSNGRFPGSMRCVEMDFAPDAARSFAFDGECATGNRSERSRVA